MIRGQSTFNSDDEQQQQRVEELQQADHPITDALADDMQHSPIYDRNKAHQFSVYGSSGD